MSLPPIVYNSNTTVVSELPVHRCFGCDHVAGVFANSLLVALPCWGIVYVLNLSAARASNSVLILRDICV